MSDTYSNERINKRNNSFFLFFFKKQANKQQENGLAYFILINDFSVRQTSFLTKNHFAYVAYV